MNECFITHEKGAIVLKNNGCFSIQNIRVKSCPYTNKFYHIRAYAKMDKYNPEQDDKNKMHHLLIREGRRSGKRLETKIEKIRNKDRNLFQKRHLSNNADSKIFYSIDHDRDSLSSVCRGLSSCRTAYEIYGDRRFRVASQKPPTASPAEPAASDDASDGESLFSINACTYNRPGALYSFLNLAFPERFPDASITLDYDIEYIKSSLCRVKNNVKVDIFANEIRTPFRADCSGDFIQCIVIFYPTDKVIDHFNKIGADWLFKNGNFKAVKNPNGKSAIILPENAGSSRNNPVPSPRIDHRTMRCPIARVVDECPFKKKHPTKHIQFQKGETVKIEVCLANEVGALKYLYEVICRADSSRDFG